MKSFRGQTWLVILCFAILGTSQLSADSDWSYLEGRLSHDLVGVYDMLGGESVLNQPSARSNMAYWIGQDGNYYLFGGKGFRADETITLLGDFWSFNPMTQQWAWLDGNNTERVAPEFGDMGVESPTNYPGGRFDAMVWKSPDGHVYVMGGQSQNGEGSWGFRNDLWRYDETSEMWTWLGGSQSLNSLGTFGTIEVEDAGNWPPARKSGASWYGADGYLYLFGGFRIPTDMKISEQVITECNDLWRYNPENGLWTWLKGANITKVESAYGVMGVSDPLNDPGARASASCWVSPTGKLILFGGLGTNRVFPSTLRGYLNDLWEFDTATLNWTWIGGSNQLNQFAVYGELGIPDAMNTPGGHLQAHSWRIGEQLFLYGGQGFAESGFNGKLSDLWSYDLNSGLWTWEGGSKQIKEVPSLTGVSDYPGARTAGAVFATSNTVTLIAGQTMTRHGISLPSNDIWALNPQTYEWSHSGESPDPWQFTERPSVPGARADAVLVSSGNEVHLFGGSGFGERNAMGELADVWKFQAESGWDYIGGTTQINQYGVYTSDTLHGIYPGGRHGMAGGLTHDGKMYVFGGYGQRVEGRAGMLNDLWTYAPQTGLWEFISGSDQRSTTSQIDESSTGMPGSRMECASWWLADGSLYIFGGDGYFMPSQTIGPQSAPTNELWRFDAMVKTWTLMSGSTEPATPGSYASLGAPDVLNRPGARMSPGHWTDGSNLYVFGGRGAGETHEKHLDKGLLCDLWKYSTASGLWTWLGGSTTVDDHSLASLPTPGVAWPTPREDSTCWTDAHGDLYLYGGWGLTTSGEVGLLSDFWKYTPGTGQWTQIMEGALDQPVSCEGMMPVTPGARAGSQAVKLDQSIMLFGGYGISCDSIPTRLGDVWLLTPENGAWNWRQYQ